jgi:hypothetical protein
LVTASGWEAGRTRDYTARIWDVNPVTDAQDVLRQSGKMTNYRVCKSTGKIVAVLPFPDPDTIWVEDTDTPASRCELNP